ncbi:hypothetical protein [Tardiphaga sp. 709]|uniref:hypothetical protein n=1 Tax=Tardiphaga sp. 709 TaxID=3076039 RepID=UPI0028EE048F|nr:hypothetical protein [Tardiphaga sp. 709]WNV07142.1 hypothetical protein RSO67_16420 [Tardiphaga sp. 709]
MKSKIKSLGERHPVSTVPVLVKMSSAEMAAVDRWTLSRPDSKPTRPEAIRQLVELGLSVKGVRKNSASQRTRASEMAATELDFQADENATSDDQATRKRRLLKGPEEFQHVRVDRKARKS